MTTAIAILFWVLLGMAFYAYIGYGLLIGLWVKLSGKKPVWPPFDAGSAPAVSLIVPCFNEGPALAEKVKNTLALDYPKDRLEVIFICDGSSDGSEHIPAAEPSVTTLYQPERRGKLAAMKRAVQHSSGDILVFCDANTVLNAEAIQALVRPYADKRIGAVTGEKYILAEADGAASSAGEGLYWTYESFLKRMDSDLYTLVGGAGELMSYRRSLFQFLPDDTILDDFMLTMRIAEEGHLVKYVPEARASEYASANVEEEMKRKIRIAAGGWQSMSRLPRALNPLHLPMLTFQYVSHRVLRWAVVPFCLPLLLLLNHWLAWQPGGWLYRGLLLGQYIFYGLALLGYWLRGKKIPVPGFFVPYYLYVMNYCAVLGFFRWKNNNQAATWERARRANEA